MFYLALLALGGVFYYVGSRTGVSSPSVGTPTNNSSAQANGAGAQITRSNPWNLPDIDSANQGGGFDSSYDESFEKASGATGVPFALIKAHAIRESSLKPNAYHYDNSSSGASYGLLQIEWVSGSNKWSKYGDYSSDQIGDGSILYDPDTNAFLGASLMADNLNWLKGVVRDEINAYNTGVAESTREAPANYVDDVIGYYNQILGGTFV